ncbi:hypothetical protein ASG94_07415 [Nocardioides sp. Soil805]|nr:hypothetical protein ASG94_07415 [Nocardioides sp. Soil805]
MYWFRRLVVLGVAVLLVAGLARLLGGSSDASSDEDPQATTAGATTSTSAETTAPPTTPAEQPRRKRKKQTPTEPPLAEPEGTCENGDIVATPTITEAPGGSDVSITLNLRTRVTAACTWTVSPDTLTVTITSGSDSIWSSRECPAAIVPQDVVVRQAVDAPVVITWNAKRSDEECSALTEWALPGFYHVEAAALAGEPTEVQFELVRPASEVITKTVTPRPQKGTKKDNAHQPGEDGSGNSEG